MLITMGRIKCCEQPGDTQFIYEWRAQQRLFEILLGLNVCIYLSLCTLHLEMIPLVHAIQDFTIPCLYQLQEENLWRFVKYLFRYSGGRILMFPAKHTETGVQLEFQNLMGDVISRTMFSRRRHEHLIQSIQTIFIVGLQDIGLLPLNKSNI